MTMLTLNFHTSTEGSNAYSAPAAIPAIHAITATSSGRTGQKQRHHRRHQRARDHLALNAQIDVTGPAMTYRVAIAQ